MKKLLLLMVCPFFLLAQTQVGQPINGEASGDRFGWASSLSADGNTLAVGAYVNDGNGDAAGHVRIFTLSARSWTQLGSDIDGAAADDWFGQSISLSANGSRVAVGAIGNDGNGNNAGHVRVFENVGGTWTQMGTDIEGEFAGDNFGGSVCLSADGLRLIAGAESNDEAFLNAGHARVFEFTAGDWVQLGADIDGVAIQNLAGQSVSISGDGTRVAVGAPGNSDMGGQVGMVQVFTYTGGSWSQVGNNIYGEASGDWSGESVSLSYNGTVVSIGASGNSGGAGHVRVYGDMGGTWTQVGGDIDGEAAGDFFGLSTSLSDNGSVLAVGARGNDGNGSNSGKARVYKNMVGTWQQIGTDLTGAAGDACGTSVSLSTDGVMLSVGSPLNDAGGSSAGQVNIYDLSGPLSVDDKSVLQGVSLYPNPASEWVQVDGVLEQGIALTVYNALGQVVLQSKAPQLNIGDLAAGIYSVHISTVLGETTQKLVVE